MRFWNRNLVSASYYCASNDWDGCTIVKLDNPSSRTDCFDVFVAEIIPQNYFGSKFVNDVKL